MSVELPTQERVVAQASQVIGGPVGRYARLRLVANSAVGPALRWQPVAAVLSILSSLLLGLGVVQKSYCLSNGYGAPEVFWRACYIDMPYLFANTQLATGGAPYPGRVSGSTIALSQPVVTGWVLAATARLVPGSDEVLKRQAAYVGIWAVLIALLVVAIVALTAATCRRNPWRAAHVALSPLLVSIALVSPDLVGVALASLGLFLWARSAPLWAGVVFGVAISARTYPLLIVVVLGLLALRAGRLRAWAETAGAALLTSVALLVAGGVGNGFADLKPYAAWWSAKADYGSVWYLAKVVGMEVPGTALTIIVIASWVIALLAGAALALGAPRRPRVAEVALVVVALVIILGKNVPVQTTIWLLPLVALAGLRWRDHLIWATCEVMYFVGVWMYLGGASDAGKSLPIAWYGVFVLIRLLGVLSLVVRVVATAWSRPRSVVLAPPSASPADGERADPDGSGAPAYPAPEAPTDAPGDEVDDGAGVLAGRPDRVIVAFA